MAIDGGWLATLSTPPWISPCNIMNAQSLYEQEFHRSMLFKLMRTVKYLAKQGLPLRGHNESAEVCQGNLYQLLLSVKAEECPSMKPWLQKREYISPVIVDEIINLMEQNILRGIISDVKGAQWYAIIADEATVAYC